MVKPSKAPDAVAGATSSDTAIDSLPTLHEDNSEELKELRALTESQRQQLQERDAQLADVRHQLAVALAEIAAATAISAIVQ